MRTNRPGRLTVWLLAAVAVGGVIWTWRHFSRTAEHAANQAQPAVPAKTGGSGGVTTNTAESPRVVQHPTNHSQHLPLTNTLLMATNLDVSADRNLRAAEGHFPRVVENVFEMQVLLARQGLSPGSIDGLIGPQTRAALRSFQRKENLPMTGELDNATRACLVLTESPTTSYEISSNDLSRLQPLSPTWLGKSQQTALEYETILELLSEKAQAHPLLIKRLNPDLDWAGVIAGSRIEIPKICYLPASKRATSITIQLEQKVLEAWDENTNLLAHFPCSIARLVEKRPLGELHVAVIVHDPNYTFDPENFPESAEAHDLKNKLILPPGPNNPVGTAWIGLDKPGYGIHGTPNPEQVGHTESHGCFRLANWNAEYLAKLAAIGTPVYVNP